MSRLLLFYLLFCCASFSFADEHILPNAELSYEKDIRPIFKAACFHCHGEEAELQGSLDVRLRRMLIKGGDSGSAIIAGDASKSYLIERIKSGEMPPEDAGKPLSTEQVAIIEKWIDLGAPTLRTEPESIPLGLVITEDDRNWWSFQPVVRPQVPEVESIDRVRTPIDAFILRQLEAKQLTLTPTADRRTLIRRAYFDLLGLPPTPEAVEKFVNDSTENAWETLIDELLASPHFGERWGRHWLDVAGYADSEGVSDTDPERAWAWKYRDYVIQSLNANKPYDQFVREQLAGDEMIAPPYKNLSPEQIEKLTATGFLRMAPDGTMSKEVEAGVARNSVMANTIQIVGSSLLGMTVHCAQCHEHRYDPIPQTDYYRMRAVFEPALDWKNWKTPAQRQISLYTDEDRKQAAELEAEAKKILADRTEKEKEFIEATFQKELAKLPESERDAASAARNENPKKRTVEQKALMKKYPSLNVSAGSLYLYDKKAADELKKMSAEATKVRAKKPKEEYLRVVSETPGKVPQTFLFARGDHEQPKEEVKPNGLSILQQVSVSIELPENDPTVPSTGRRLAYAKYLTDGKHPLVARVAVNRIWMHLLGRGIVESPADFGRLGLPPTHPQLLDWLASDFVDQGWNIKQTIKSIMLSETYRQGLSNDPHYWQADPDNNLLGSARIKRVEAEVLRDSTLALTGKLNEKAFGPPVPVMADIVGQWVIGKENLNAGRPGPVIDMKGEQHRRSIYIQVRRSRPLAVLETFDSPRMDPNCDARSVTTVSTQSLMLMNGAFVREQSEHLGTRVISDAGDEVTAQIRRLWELVFSRQPSDSELADAQQFLTEQTEDLKSRVKKDEPPQQLALASLCQVLLGSNEFLYLD